MRSKTPVSMPIANPTKSYWQTPPSILADHRSTESLPSTAKYVIVGSGVTGASIAYKLLQVEPDVSIVMLEARQACSGATGRNGGHCRAGRYLSFRDSVKNFGQEDALRLEALEEANVRNVAAFIKDHDIDCDLRAVDSVDIFTDQLELDEALACLKDRKNIFLGREEAKVLTKHKVWSEKQAREELLVPEALGAVSFPAYVLQPYKLLCGILRMCLEQGLNLQTNTPVLDVHKAHKSHLWTVSTERGDISADRVILATNAYTGALYPRLADFIIPTRAQLIAMRPGSNISSNPLLEKSVSLNSAITGDYFQVRQEPFSGAGDMIYGRFLYCLNDKTLTELQAEAAILQSIKNSQFLMIPPSILTSQNISAMVL